jgi:hypothetical protein
MAFFDQAVPMPLQASPGADLGERFVDFVHQPISCSDRAYTGIFVERSSVPGHVRARLAQRES